MAKTTTSYQKDLIEALKDPYEAAAYLNAAIEEGDREVFLLALRNMAEANGGMGAVAAKANLSRESLYRMLSKRGNPEVKTCSPCCIPWGCASPSRQNRTHVMRHEEMLMLVISSFTIHPSSLLLQGDAGWGSNARG